MTNNIFTHIPTDKEALDRIRTAVSSFISGKRLIHTYSVEKEAIRIAGIMFPYLGIDEKYYSDISASALLHDITKYLSPDEQNALCKEFGIDTDAYSFGNCAVLHSKTAAHIAKRDFDINDIVFGAIYCHTTGKENMNIFEKIIFIADYIEETRTHSSCVNARNFFYDNLHFEDKTELLNKTIIMSIDATLDYLIRQGNVIDTDTIKARNFLLAEYALQRSVQE